MAGTTENANAAIKTVKDGEASIDKTSILLLVGAAIAVVVVAGIAYCMCMQKNQADDVGYGNNIGANEADGDEGGEREPVKKMFKAFIVRRSNKSGNRQPLTSNIKCSVNDENA